MKIYMCLFLILLGSVLVLGRSWAVRDESNAQEFWRRLYDSKTSFLSYYCSSFCGTVLYFISYRSVWWCLVIYLHFHSLRFFGSSRIVSQYCFVLCGVSYCFISFHCHVDLQIFQSIRTISCRCQEGNRKQPMCDGLWWLLQREQQMLRKFRERAGCRLLGILLLSHLVSDLRI